MFKNHKEFYDFIAFTGEFNKTLYPIRLENLDRDKFVNFRKKIEIALKELSEETKNVS